MLYFCYLFVSLFSYLVNFFFILLTALYLIFRFLFKIFIPTMQRAIDLLHNFLFLCFFIWEILGLKKYRHTIFFLVYLVALILLWASFYVFMFRWVQGVYHTYYSNEQLQCMLLFIWLTIFHFLFSEARRFLRHFLEDYIIYDEDWEWEQDTDSIEDITEIREYFKRFVIENKLSLHLNEKS